MAQDKPSESKKNIQSNDTNMWCLSHTFLVSSQCVISYSLRCLQILQVESTHTTDQTSKGLRGKVHLVKLQLDVFDGKRFNRLKVAQKKTQRSY